MAGEGVSERFPATGSRGLGVAMVLLAAGLLALAVAERDESWARTTALVGVVLGATAWASMLRPALKVDDDALVMRNMVDTVRVPLAAIEQVAVRQVLAVRAGDKRYLSPVVGRSRRQLTRAERASGKAEPPVPGGDYTDVVEQRIRALAEDARAARGIRLMSEEQVALARGVRRHWDWPTIALLVVPLVLLVVSMAV